MQTTRQGKLAVMGPKGDAEIHWDSEDEESIDAAKKMFEDLIEKGYMAYRCTDVGKGEQIRKFDSDLEEIVMTPPVGGG